MLKDIWEQLFQWYLFTGLKYGLIRDNLEQAEFKITDFKLYPPTPGTLMAGEPITAEVSYTSNLKGRRIQIWVLSNNKDLQSFYDSSGIEPSNGSVMRSFEVADVGHLDSVMVTVSYFDRREILTVAYPADYQIIENPEKEALKSDGAGASLEIVEVRLNGKTLKSNSKVSVGQSVDVMIKYQHDAQYEVRLWAMPAMDGFPSGGYSSGEIPSNNKSGAILKSFTLDTEAKLEGVHVHMVNVADETIAEQFLDFPIEIVK